MNHPVLNCKLTLEIDSEIHFLSPNIGEIIHISELINDLRKAINTLGDPEQERLFSSEPKSIFNIK